MNPLIDLYLTEGCGRCILYQTPECKAIRWQVELRILRALILECELDEELKWSMPCYTFQGRIVLILAAFKDHVSISFFQGSIMSDPEGMLTSAGENTQAARQLKFNSKDQIASSASLVKQYVMEAISLERAGKRAVYKNPADQIRPEELEDRLNLDPALREAFESLTPGKRRGYILYIAGAKQSSTRAARVERCVPKIMAGKAFEDR